MTDASKGKLFCFGFGYTAHALADLLAGDGFRIAGTSRNAGAAAGPFASLATFDGTAGSADVVRLLEGTTHLLLSIPPDTCGDPALRHFAGELERLQSLRWIGYLSTIGVYGDCGGAWIDETAPLRPQSDRGARRVVAEEQWRAFGDRSGVTVDIFRLPGIYGPGRSPLEGLRAGTARRIVKQGQVFNRIHVADIARGLAAVIGAEVRVADLHTFNLVDDEPAPPQDVVTYAAGLLGIPPPPEIPIEAADLSPMGRSFYTESKRVENACFKSTFDFKLTYPTYREGLTALARSPPDSR